MNFLFRSCYLMKYNFGMKIYDRENKFRWESYYSSEKLSYGNFEHKTWSNFGEIWSVGFSVHHLNLFCYVIFPIWQRSQSTKTHKHRWSTVEVTTDNTHFWKISFTRNLKKFRECHRNAKVAAVPDMPVRKMRSSLVPEKSWFTFPA